MNEIIVTTKQELVRLIQSVIRNELSILNLFKSKEERQILNVYEAAEFTGLAKQTIYDKTFKKQIPHHKKGKKLYFLKDELEKWLLGDSKVNTEEEQREEDMKEFIRLNKKHKNK